MSPTSTGGDAVDVDQGAAVTNSANAGSVSPTDEETSKTASAEVTAAAWPGPSREPEGDLDALAGADAAPRSAPVDLVDEPGEQREEPAGDDAAIDEEETLDYDQAAELDEPVLFDDLEDESSDPDLDEDLLAPPEMSQMLFVDVVLLLPATHPVVVLQEADSPFRELRIPVGGAEGIAIGYAARGIATPRPLTHELLTRVLEEYGMTIDVVRITDVSGASFSAELVVSGPQGIREIDCRPSDAIALALRQRLPVPIVASPMVLAIAGTDPLGSN
jgi:bifunctional DNase/RNase